MAGKKNYRCLTCEKEFVSSNKNPKFCSRSCLGKSRVGKRNSFWGKKHTEETKSLFSKLKKGKKPWITGKHHTEESKKKMSLSRMGKVPWNKGMGGRVIKHGYVFIMKSDHPFCNASGYVREHRLVMERNLGRYLSPEEVVHHINGNKKDNRLENLRLFTTNQQHEKVCHSKRPKKSVRSKYEEKGKQSV